MLLVFRASSEVRVWLRKLDRQAKISKCRHLVPEGILVLTNVNYLPVRNQQEVNWSPAPWGCLPGTVKGTLTQGSILTSPVWALRPQRHGSTATWNSRAQSQMGDTCAPWKLFNVHVPLTKAGGPAMLGAVLGVGFSLWAYPIEIQHKPHVWAT